MGTRARKGKIIEVNNARMAEYLCQAAQRYHNINKYLEQNQPNNWREKHRTNLAKANDCDELARKFDPVVTQSFIERRDRYSNYNYRWRYRS